MLRSLHIAIDDALDTLYGPNAAFSQFLGSASMTFILLSPFLASSCLAFLASSCLFLLFWSFLSVPFLFFCFFVFYFFPSLYLIFFFLCFFFPIDLRLSCVCVVIGCTW